MIVMLPPPVPTGPVTDETNGMSAGVPYVIGTAGEAPEQVITTDAVPGVATAGAEQTSAVGDRVFGRLHRELLTVTEQPVAKLVPLIWMGMLPFVKSGTAVDRYVIEGGVFVGP